MMELIESVWNYIKQTGAEHNVDPVIFAVLYIVTIPTYMGSMVWAVRNHRKGKSVVIPVISTLLNFILPAIYIIIFGKDVAWWVYAIIAFIVLYGGFSVIKKLKERLQEPSSES